MSRVAQRWLTTGVAFNPGALGNLELRLSGSSLGAYADDDPISPWADTSGMGRNATGAGVTRPRKAINGNVNNPYSPSGLPGTAFNFGENDRLTGSIAFDYTAGMTAYAWINESPFGVNDQCVFCPNTSSPKLFVAGGTGKIGFGDADGEHASATQIKGVSANHHVAWVFYPPATGAGVARVYLNGSLIQDTTWHITAGPASYTIGNNDPTTMPFGGVIYEFMLYSAPHDVATIAAMRGYGQSVWGV